MKLRFFELNLDLFLVLSLLALKAKHGALGKIMTEIEMQTNLERMRVIPEVITDGPEHYLWIEWPNGAKAEFGNTLDPRFCENIPILIKWDWQIKKCSTLIFVDADQKIEGVPGNNSYLLWLCVNIEGPLVLKSQMLAKYYPPKPAKNTGVHRFIWFLFEQPRGYQRFKFPPVKDNLDAPSYRRTNFSVTNFARQNRLGKLLAANFFLVPS